MERETAMNMPTECREPRVGDLMNDGGLEMQPCAAGDPRLTEDLALAMLARRDLPAAAVEALARNGSVMGSRRVMCAVAAHPHTPRHLSLPLLRHLFTFELMQIALQAAVVADLKRAAEDAILSRLDTVNLGKRLTLARQGTGRIAAALIGDPELIVVEAALRNPQITEAAVVRAVSSPALSRALLDFVQHNPKWSLCAEVQAVLARRSARQNRSTAMAAGART